MKWSIKTESYVRGRVHANGMENFWSLLKRGIKRNLRQPSSRFTLFRYIGRAGISDSTIAPRRDNPRSLMPTALIMAVRQIVGKRLTYKELTGKDEERPAPAQPF